MPFFYALLRRQEILYYCEVASDGKMTLHRGGKDGPVIGTANPCTVKEGCTDIELLFPKLTISLHHKEHLLPLLHSKTSFSAENKAYHWKGYDELVEDDTNKVVAKFHSKWWQDDTHKMRIGRLDVNETEMRDLIVFTAVIVEERAQEKLPPFYQL